MTSERGGIVPHAARRDTNPKRQRGLEALPSLALPEVPPSLPLWAGMAGPEGDIPRRVRYSTFLRELGHGALMVALSLYVVNMGYMFEGAFQPLGKVNTGRKLLNLAGAGSEPPGWLAAIPMPLPGDYVGGLAETAGVAEDRYWSYFCGEWRRGGWWYFYPCALTIKLPLGALALMVIACLGSKSKSPRARWRDELCLLIPILVILVFVTWSGITQQMRYALPVFPFAVVWAGKATRVVGRKGTGTFFGLGTCTQYDDPTRRKMSQSPAACVREATRAVAPGLGR